MNKDFYNHIKVTSIIESYCASHKINESDLARLVGVHPSHLPRVKSGEMCSYKTLSKIALLGKVEVSDLLMPIPNKLKTEIIAAGKLKSLPVFV
jgi:DNA-binding Xre family transcriptional regulator